MPNYANSEVLVDTQWVADRLDDPKVRVVESNVDRSAYDSGHIPGAVAWTWNEDFQHPVRKDIPDKEGFEALLSRSGIANDTTVVLYGTPGNWYATFAFWLMKIYGHGDVRVMNGGRKKWVDEGRPMTTGEPGTAPASYTAKEPDWSIRAMRDLVHDSIGRSDRVLVDVRSPEEYGGQLLPVWKLPNEAGQRGGHIPGAINIPWNMAYKEDETFKPVEELQALYEDKGVTPDKEVIPYCVIGGRSNQTWFVLKHLLGYPKVRLYDGSWLEWGGLIGVPVER